MTERKLEPPGAGHGHAHGIHGHSHGSSAQDRAGHYAFSPRTITGARPALERGCAHGQVLFVDCPSGISGDMLLSALIDLGVPRDVFDEAILAVGLTNEAKLIVEHGQAGVVLATRARVEVTNQPGERSYATIRALIENSNLGSNVRTAALAVFERLAHAEAQVHGTPLDLVTFHEVGATDSIVDIVGAAAGLEFLGAEMVVSPLPICRGFVLSQHGRLPLPAPATLLCLAGVPTLPDPLDVELVTPTGAAIVGALAQRFASWPALVPAQVGWGAGTMALADRPNALRLVLGTPMQQGVGTDRVVLLEANVDDMTGEVLAHALDCLLAAGALDAWITPITMKKGRPAFVISALAAPERALDLERTYFAETTTLGVRRREVERSVLPREVVEVPTRFGPVPVKQSGVEPQRWKPEFDACVAIAAKLGIPVRVVLEEALAQARSRR